MSDVLRRVFELTDNMKEDLEAEVTPKVREPLLVTREQTHGSFSENAALSQMMKRVLRSSPGWERLTDIEREVMDMICLKFSRVLSGKSRERQHWEDVVGYARLAEEDCLP
jgi:hypothetical protein